jgi:hypothetical protein
MVQERLVCVQVPLEENTILRLKWSISRSHFSSVFRRIRPKVYLDSKLGRILLVGISEAAHGQILPVALRAGYSVIRYRSKN